jgi:hypothetical protein
MIDSRSSGKINIKISAVVVNAILAISFILPTLQQYYDIKLHRIPYILTLLIAIFVIIKRCKIYKKYLFTSIIIFTIAATGTYLVGTEYTSFLSPVIYGIMFYTIINKNYHFDFVKLYKFLIVTIFIELLFINIIDYKYIISFFHSLNFDLYQPLGTKFGLLINRDLYTPNSLFYGPQITSMILAISIIFFSGYYVNKSNIVKTQHFWLTITIGMFIISFSITSLIMLIIAFGKKKISKYYLYIIAIFLLIFFIFISGAISYQAYLDTFSSFPLYWLERDIKEMIFGFPNVHNPNMAMEFGYVHILKNIGGLNVMILIVLNVILVLRKRNVHSIIVTMFHVSLIHYHPALRIGVEQLFGLHIAYAMHEN